MVILDPDLEERTIAPSLDRFLTVVTNSGGTVKTEIWGRRRLAYEIKKQVEGIYAIVTIESDPAAVAELDRSSTSTGPCSARRRRPPKPPEPGRPNPPHPHPQPYVGPRTPGHAVPPPRFQP